MNQKLKKILLVPIIGIMMTLFAIPAASSLAATTPSADLQSNPIVKDLQIIVNFLSAGVGIAVVGVIILGGIQYSLAGDNPQAVSAAKQRITNGLIAFAVFMFTFAFLQWLIPGGIFG